MKKIISSYEEHVKQVESQLGMSLDEYHLMRENYNSDPQRMVELKKNQDILNQWLEDKKPLVTYKRKGRKYLKLAKDEYFLPLYDPNVDGRNELATNIFVSNYKHVLYVSKDEQVYYYHPHHKIKYTHYSDGTIKSRTVYYDRDFFHLYHGFLIKDNGKPRTKKITVYTLMALVFGNEDTFFGKAKEYLHEFGLYAFGSKNDLYALQAHHIKRATVYPDLVYEPSNIQFLTVRAHSILKKYRVWYERLTKCPSDPNLDIAREEINYEYFEMIKQEAPNKTVSVVMTDKYYYKVY